MAGGVTLGFLKYVLGFDSIAFRKGMTDAERDLVAMQKSFEKKGKQFQDLGKNLTAFVTLPMAGIAAAGIKEAQETQQAMAQVNAALASMGPVAGKSAAELQNFANALELKSTFEADEILRKVTANLLTFGNIGKQAFDQAQQAAVDLATRMGTDLQSATVLVGKALNDPIKGLTALSRVGIQFTAAQKAQIKAMVEAGNVAGAQKIILGELQRQYGGAAEAAAKTDPLNQANKAWKQMAETIGTALLPILPVFANAVASIANAFASLSPGVQQAIIVVGGIAAALGPALIGFGGLIKVIAGVGPAVLALSKAWAAFKVAMAAARVAALATLPALTPFLIPLAAIAAAVGVAYLAWKNWDKIKAIVSSVYAAVKTYLVDKFNGIVESVRAKVDAVIGFFHNLWDKVVGHSYVPDMVTAIGVEMAKLDALLVQPAAQATSKAAEAFRALQERVSSLLQRLYPEQATQNQFLKDLQDLKDYAEKAKWSLEQLEDATNRLRQQTFNLPSTAAISEDLLNTPLAPERVELDYDALGKIAGGMGQIVDRTQQWKQALSDIGGALFQRIGDDVSRLVDGSMRLKDLWRDLLAFGIQALTSPNGPLGSLIGGVAGARAAGGDVNRGLSYLVGEKGPEIFTPSRSGRIISNDNSRRLLGGGMQPLVQNFNFPNSDFNSFRRNETQAARLGRRMLRTS